MPLVSIIIPAYNLGHYLDDALRSVLAQSITDFEVIVVNDGSTDDTQHIVEPFLADPRCKYILQPNQGLPAARNRGLEASAGQFIHFLDADDWLDPLFLETMITTLQANPDAGFAYCDITTVHQSDGTQQASLVATARSTLTGDIFESLLLGGYFPPHCVVVRRQIFEQVGNFDLRLGGHADWDMWLRIAAHGFRAIFVPKALVYYRLHGHNMSRDRQHMHQTRKAVYEKITQMFPNKVGSTVDTIARQAEDLYTANQWLEKQLETQIREQQCSLEIAQGENRTLKKYIDDLKEARDWHQQKSQEWETSYHQQVGSVEELRHWSAQLEEAKQWYDQQLKIATQAYSEAHDELRNLRAILVNLGLENTRLRAEIEQRSLKGLAAAAKKRLRQLVGAKTTN